MARDEVFTALRRHLVCFFAGHTSSEHQWMVGPAVEKYPCLRVLEFAPGPRTGLWTYCSVGAWEAPVISGSRLEFCLAAPGQDLRQVELVTMTVHYHHLEKLGLGHTFPIGEPWLTGSICDHMLVSLPYPFGAELECCSLCEPHVRYLWLLPITTAERKLKMEQGHEALEERFDAAAIDFWNPRRASVA